MADESEHATAQPRNATSNPSHAASGSRQTAQTSTITRQPALDRQDASRGAGAPPKSGVVQPTPQALPRRTGPAAIIVSVRQKGNPVLDKIKSMPWEYADIKADYVLGVTTCALFLSLKYHRLHPEYIYTRIKDLQGKFALRILLCLVDITNHEETLKELSKTSLINNVTVVLCWSATEGARYLELFKTYENAAPTSIKQHQSTTYSDRLVDFVTAPRSINKTDAVSLVSQFGTIRTAVNARHEEVSTIAGWGDKKVQQWCNSVQEPFRIKRTAKRGIDLENLDLLSQSVSGGGTLSRAVTREESVAEEEDETEYAGIGNELYEPAAAKTNDADRRPAARVPEPIGGEGDAGPESIASNPSRADRSALSRDSAAVEAPRKRKPDTDPVSEGVMAALNKLRKT
ncbi:related to mating-type switching protein swi10 [Ramularia collo-cygni]|uniref:Related to mating-type switching protein swi10 n=1 Tax=Ramularia collo-cygni TaxID=112498 RepID=A0A2D3VC60_9PEZI|nr:related to mating-type switching protein swi10 [Ramularia collo-cygni]CZT24580.1 related to mating-type switching protein swi10 [Ramularia collo-cygni]